MQINKIVVTGDFFRTTERCEPTQLSNVLWLYNLVRDSLSEATGLQPEIWFGENGLERQADLRSLRLSASFYRAMGLDPSLSGWSTTYFKEPAKELVDLVGRELSGSIIFCVEMSPLLQRIFDRLELPWIDINISPLRFLEDLCVSFRFSRHFEVDEFSEFFLWQEDIARRVSRVRQFYADIEFDYKDAVIFFAQTEIDRTLLTNNGLYEMDDVLYEMQKLIRGRSVFIKPHPFSKTNPIIEMMRSGFGARCVADNTYALLASGIDCEFATISSSVGYEACVFGKKAAIFNENMLRWINSGPISLTCYRDSRFWARLLEPVIPTKIVQTEPVAIEPNRLRKQLSSFSLDPGIWEGTT